MSKLKMDLERTDQYDKGYEVLHIKCVDGSEAEIKIDYTTRTKARLTINAPFEMKFVAARHKRG